VSTPPERPETTPPIAAPCSTRKISLLRAEKRVEKELPDDLKRVAGKSDLTMTCLAAEIDFRNGTLKACNASHTFPILVRENDPENVARHLHKGQQRMLGAGMGEDGEAPFASVTYPLQAGDLLVMYTDGLSEAKSLKSGIFGRFLFRSLKHPRSFASAGELRDEILAMFNYYTQQVPIEDDVCFLVVKLPEKAASVVEPLARGA